jgi:hypothetical protein
METFLTLAILCIIVYFLYTAIFSQKEGQDSRRPGRRKFEYNCYNLRFFLSSKSNGTQPAMRIIPSSLAGFDREGHDKYEVIREDYGEVIRRKSKARS